MAKYIEQEAAIEILNIAYPLGMDEAAYDTMHSMISKLPAADVVEVVRCKDCKNGTEAQYFPTGWWCWKHGFPAPKDGYCWEGVKRDG